MEVSAQYTQTPNKHMKILKYVTIEATFPELKGRFFTPTGRAQALTYVQRS